MYFVDSEPCSIGGFQVWHLVVVLIALLTSHVVPKALEHVAIRPP